MFLFLTKFLYSPLVFFSHLGPPLCFLKNLTSNLTVYINELKYIQYDNKLSIDFGHLLKELFQNVPFLRTAILSEYSFCNVRRQQFVSSTVQSLNLVFHVCPRSLRLIRVHSQIFSIFLDFSKMKLKVKWLKYNYRANCFLWQMI
jgi:hypothetical protein